MLQVRRNEPTRCRRIKRDLSTIPKKGIAGIRSFASDQQSLIEQMSNLTISSPSDSVPVSSNIDNSNSDIRGDINLPVNTNDDNLTPSTNSSNG